MQRRVQETHRDGGGEDLKEVLGKRMMVDIDVEVEVEDDVEVEVDVDIDIDVDV